MEQEKEHKLYMLGEVAVLLRISRSSLRSMIDRKVIPTIKIGMRERVRKADLDKVLMFGTEGEGE